MWWRICSVAGICEVAPHVAPGTPCVRALEPGRPSARHEPRLARNDIGGVCHLATTSSPLQPCHSEAEGSRLNPMPVSVMRLRTPLEAAGQPLQDPLRGAVLAVCPDAMMITGSHSSRLSGVFIAVRR